eukprot:TRINITY_DN16327_c0_g1_i1.p1 TRINITY_DN16327_c0_g1~~TRINITY_DN16327_c0_g1_i1.p1  ORF type:complete len:276 (-),score=30.68 TRINITY_DN16327_c0_g1_i1:152-979(-)
MCIRDRRRVHGIAKGLKKDGVSIEIISKNTGLTKEEIEELIQQQYGVQYCLYSRNKRNRKLLNCVYTNVVRHLNTIVCNEQYRQQISKFQLQQRVQDKSKMNHNKFLKKQIRSAWTILNEREFSENIMNNRLNILLIIYAIFIGAFFQTNNVTNKVIISLIGTILTGFSFLTIYRAYRKVRIIIEIIRKMSKKQAFNLVEHVLDRKVKNKKSKVMYGKYHTNIFIGVFIPGFAFLTMICLFIWAIISGNYFQEFRRLNAVQQIYYMRVDDVLECS